MESLSTRLDEVEEELVQLLSLRSDDLQIFSSRQDQLLQSHYHSLSSALETAQNQLQKLTNSTGLSETAIRKKVKGKWIERRNLKRFWVFCEEIQRQEGSKYPTSSFDNSSLEESDDNTTRNYQTPNGNDSNSNLSTLSNMSDLSLN